MPCLKCTKNTIIRQRRPWNTTFSSHTETVNWHPIVDVEHHFYSDFIFTFHVTRHDIHCCSACRLSERWSICAGCSKRHLQTLRVYTPFQYYGSPERTSIYGTYMVLNILTLLTHKSAPREMFIIFARTWTVYVCDCKRIHTYSFERLWRICEQVK